MPKSARSRETAVGSRLAGELMELVPVPHPQAVLERCRVDDMLERLAGD